MEQWSKYLEGNMTVEELDAFTGLLVQARFDREKRLKWQEILEKEHRISRKPAVTKPSSGRILKIGLQIAAGVLVLLVAGLGIYFMNQTPDPQQYVDTYLEEGKFRNAISRKGEIDIPALRLEAAEAYTREEYEVYLNRFNQILQSGQAETHDYLFAGLSYLYSDQYEQASDHFILAKQQSEREEGAFRQEIQWFLALSLVKAEEFDQAEKALEQIETSDWNYEKAQELIHLMDQHEE